jgi:2'-5' RNA ligase
MLLDQLLDMMEGIQNARWQNEEQLHVTLRFIGEVDRHAAEDVAVALGAVRAAPFEICLSSVGTFLRGGKGTLWAGLTPPDALKSLHKKIDQACLRAGIAADTRAYHPHITLARIGRETGPLEPFLERWAALSSQAFPVDSIRLYESHLSSDGASYTTVAGYALG